MNRSCCECDFKPVILHQKHKVVGLVKQQLLKIRVNKCNNLYSAYRRQAVQSFLVLFLLVVFLFLVALAATGPFSRTSPHTPVSLFNFLTTDSMRSLMRKNLLRWSCE